MKTLEAKIATLKQENENKLKSEIACIELQEKLIEATGLEFMVVDYSRKCEDFGAFIENGSYKGNKFDRFKIYEYIENAIKILNLEPVNYVFRGSTFEPFSTVSNCHITIDNNVSELCFNHTTMVKISFKFKGLSIDFKVPLHSNAINSDLLDTREVIKPGNEHKTKTQQRKRCYSIRGFKTIGYYGGSAVTGCVNKGQLGEFLDIAFNGGF